MNFLWEVRATNGRLHGTGAHGTRRGNSAFVPICGQYFNFDGRCRLSTGSQLKRRTWMEPSLSTTIARIADSGITLVFASVYGWQHFVPWHFVRSVARRPARPAGSACHLSMYLAIYTCTVEAVPWGPTPNRLN
jgi:hypothetical protein